MHDMNNINKMGTHIQWHSITYQKT